MSYAFRDVDPFVSRRMRNIRRTDTRPEMAVRKMAHRLGYRFRLHRRDLPGSPDLVFPRRRKIVFVHGCFWHQHEGCRHATFPRTRLEYWHPKLARNVERDREVTARLESLGWHVSVVWECQTKDVDALAHRLQEFLDAPSSGMRDSGTITQGVER